MAKVQWIKSFDWKGRTVKNRVAGMRMAWQTINHTVEIWAWVDRYEILRDKLNGHPGMVIVAKCDTLAEAKVKAREIMKSLS